VVIAYAPKERRTAAQAIGLGVILVLLLLLAVYRTMMLI
jgi:hypothetical protein